MTTWVRVDCDVPTDERLLCTGHALYWPAILIRAKKGAGHLTALAANPAQLAHLWGSTVDAWSAAIEHFIRVGMLTPRADGDAVRAGVRPAGRQAVSSLENTCWTSSSSSRASCRASRLAATAGAATGTVVTGM